MKKEFNKWVAMWGNAVSIAENKPEGYAKNITLRYPIYCPFDGNRIRLTFDNYCGTEPVQIEKTVAMLDGICYPVTFSNERKAWIEAGNHVASDERKAWIEAGGQIVSDEIAVDITRGKTLYVSFYLKECTQMRSAVYVQGPLSGGKYAIGDCTEEVEFDIQKSRRTNMCYFLSNISILTEEQNRAIVCYGDSITAQDWPDYLTQKLEEKGITNISIIRRATSGSRILRQYSCITYESYGLMGVNRFAHEVPTDGADTVIIQQGINDIIHPVGVEVNPFRPMSDLPTSKELAAGLDWYVEQGKNYGYRVILGTLLPIEGWRTYAEFREVLRNEYNQHLRTHELADGLIDFDKAVCNPENPKAFAKGCDSGDHLHPSAYGYEQMAECALAYILEELGE